MIKHAIYVFIAAVLAAAVFSLFGKSDAYALDQIIRSYQSARSSAMGSVVLTTGLYDENFFGNPARVTANPTWKLQLPDPMVELSTGALSAVDDFVGANRDTLSDIADKTRTTS